MTVGASSETVSGSKHAKVDKGLWLLCAAFHVSLPREGPIGPHLTPTVGCHWTRPSGTGKGLTEEALRTKFMPPLSSHSSQPYALRTRRDGSRCGGSETLARCLLGNTWWWDLYEWSRTSGFTSFGTGCGVVVVVESPYFTYEDRNVACAPVAGACRHVLPPDTCWYGPGSTIDHWQHTSSAAKRPTRMLHEPKGYL